MCNNEAGPHKVTLKTTYIVSPTLKHFVRQSVHTVDNPPVPTMTDASNPAAASTTTPLMPFNSTVPPHTNGTRTHPTAVPDGCMVLSVEPGDFIPWDNPDNLVSQEVEQAVDLAVAVFFLPALLLLSVPTNVVNMLVFWRHGVRERINLCLFCLSLADLIYIIQSFLHNVDKLYQPFTGETGVGVVFQFFVNHHLLFLSAFSWESGFLSMLIACERCLCVYNPLRAQKIFKTRTTGVAIFFSTLVHHGLLFIGGTRWGTACVFDPVTNSTSRAIYPTKFYLQNQDVIDAISGIVASLLLPVCYTTVICVTTAMTLIKLREVATWRKQTSSASAVSSREVALTRMLIGISVLYMVCSMPTLAFGTVLLAVPDMSTKGRYYNAFNLIASVFELCSYVNASFNFFVYCSLGSKYKETLREIFFCCSENCSDQLKQAGRKGYNPSVSITTATSAMSTGKC